MPRYEDGCGPACDCDEAARRRHEDECPDGPRCNCVLGAVDEAEAEEVRSDG